jgi:serine/threonine protein phosphatase PrpC
MHLILEAPSTLILAKLLTLHPLAFALLRLAYLQERLAAAGGRVFFNSGLRVMGILATTRAIGDHDLRPYGVVPTPDVLVLPRAAEQEFLALGSDGLWDVLNNQVGWLQVVHVVLLKW